MSDKIKSSLSKLGYKALRWPREAKFFATCFVVYWLLALIASSV